MNRIIINFAIMVEYSKDFYDFIQHNADRDVQGLRLKYHGKKSDFDLDFAITQIECRRKCSKKLKKLLDNPYFIFPDAVVAEQSTCQAVASYHAMLVSPDETVLDMTAGLGIDALTMAEKGCNVTALEISDNRVDVLKHNGHFIPALRTVCADSIEWLKLAEEHFDTIFIDPSRRPDADRRVFRLNDCLPDVVANKNLLLSSCDRLLIKTSPILDIQSILKDYPDANAISAISVKGECKEILIEVSGITDNCRFKAIDLDMEGNVISAFETFPEPFNEINYLENHDIPSGWFLYEPNASMMKISPWGSVAVRWNNLLKFDPSSHLYGSYDMIEDFPGRILKIVGTVSMKEARLFARQGVNITVRNFPMTAEQLRKKLKAPEGSDAFLYGSKIKGQNVLIAAVRI